MFKHKKEKTKKDKSNKSSSSKREKRRKDTTLTKDDTPPSRNAPTPTELKASNSGSSSDFTASGPVEDEPGLLFTGEMLNGRPIIKGGNIEKLVERLTYEKYNDAKYVKAFMLTFRSFTTPSELLQLLMNRFNISPPTGTDKKAFESTLKVIRLRVFNILRHWVNNAFYDFSNDSSLLDTLTTFIKKHIKPAMEGPSTSLQTAIEKKLTKGEKEYEHIFTGDPPAPIIPNNITPQNKNSIMTYSPKELARQLTLIEYRLFASIKPSECVAQNWMSKKKEELAPNILKMISRFNDVSNWVASEIVKCTELEQRIKVLRMAIEIAEHCYELNNYNAVMEIISGLHSSSVYRLKATWGGLPKKIVTAYEEMYATMSRDKSYKLFRAVLRAVNPPCIPYLGMYLTDLTFIEEGNPNNLPDGSINFTKRQRLSEVIAEIQTYQNTPYFLEEVSFIRDYLMNAEALPEQQCYKLSLKREGRRGTQVVDSQTPDLPFGDLEKKSSYLFDKPDTDKTIKFDKKDTEIGQMPTIIAGTLEKIVERLTYHEYQDMHFLWAFLMTFKTFTTSEKLLDLLDNRFDMPKPANPSKQQMEKFISTRLIPIHLRICNLVKSWINVYPEDFLDTEIQSKFYSLIENWASVNPKIKATTQGVRATLEKKLSEPLPTPECRYLGFLCESEESEELIAFYKDKSILDFPEDLLAKQLTLIEQNFFASIRPRECLCEEWEAEQMEEIAPNILAMKQNFDQTRLWTMTQILEQSELQKQYSALATLVVIAEKLLGNKNFSSSMAITSGLQMLQEKYPEIWQWVPSVILEKYKELELLLKMPKRIKMLEKGDATPVIPFIDIYINQLNGITNLMSDSTGSLINFERRRKQWDVYRVFEIYQGRPYNFEYDGACGGFLYHCTILSMEEIDAKLASTKRPAAPDCRPELIDIQKNYEVNELGDDNIQEDSDDDLNPTEDRDEAAIAQIKNYMLEILNSESDFLQEMIDDAKKTLASELMSDLKAYKSSAKDEFALMHSELGISSRGTEASENILGRVFQNATINNWESDDEGYVYGWKDQVNIFVVETDKGKWLAHVQSNLDKSNASVALRLFEFFSNSDAGPFKKALVTSIISKEGQEIMSNAQVSVFNFVGTQLC